MRASELFVVLAATIGGGTSPTQRGPYDTDLNGDGITNVIDLALFKAAFFQAPGPSGLVTCS